MIVRRILFFISIVCALVILLPTNAKAQLSVSLPNVSGLMGSSINIPVTVSEFDDVGGIVSFQFEVLNTPGILNFTGIETSGTLMAGKSVISNPNAVQGKITVAFAAATPVSGSGILIYLVAELVSIGESPLTFNNVLFYDSDGAQVPLDLTNGNVTVTDVEPLSPPNLTSPPNGATNVSRNPNLSWQQVTGATKYNMQVALDAGFSQLVVDQTNIPNTHFGVAGLDYETNYFWRVNAENEEQTSNWSTVWNFTTIVDPGDPGDPGDPEVPAQVTLAYPFDGQTFQLEESEKMVNLGWHSVIDKNPLYQLDIATDQNFSNIVYTNNQLTDTFYVFTNIANNQVYYWRVRASNSEGWGEYSDVWNFSTLIVGVEDESISNSFELMQNYPNPFNPSTTISFKLPERSSIKLEIYDSIGQYITTLTDGIFDSGLHELNWEAYNYSSGVYIYRLEAQSLNNAEHSVQIKSMVLMK